MAPATLLDVAGAVPLATVAKLLQAARSGSFQAVQSMVTDLIADGWLVRPATLGCVLQRHLAFLAACCGCMSRQAAMQRAAATRAIDVHRSVVRDMQYLFFRQRLGWRLPEVQSKLTSDTT